MSGNEALPKTEALTLPKLTQEETEPKTNPDNNLVIDPAQILPQEEIKPKANPDNNFFIDPVQKLPQEEIVPKTNPDNNFFIDPVQLLMAALTENKSRENDRDEYTVFGELVAYRLRSLNTDYSKATIQHKINTLLYEAQVGKYDFPEDDESRSGFLSEHSGTSNLPIGTSGLCDLKRIEKILDDKSLKTIENLTSAIKIKTQKP